MVQPQEKMRLLVSAAAGAEKGHIRGIVNWFMRWNILDLAGKLVIAVSINCNNKQ